MRIPGSMRILILLLKRPGGNDRPSVISLGKGRIAGASDVQHVLDIDINGKHSQRSPAGTC